MLFIFNFQSWQCCSLEPAELHSLVFINAESHVGLLRSGTSFVFYILQFYFWLFSVDFRIHFFSHFSNCHAHISMRFFCTCLLIYIWNVWVYFLQCFFCLYLWRCSVCVHAYTVLLFPSCLFQIWHLFLCFSHLLDCLLLHCVAPLSLDLFIALSNCWCSESLCFLVTHSSHLLVLWE